MAENKRPQRPVYNYGTDISKAERGRPSRVSYSAVQETKPQPGQKARVQYRQPQQSANRIQPLPQSTSPFYDAAADPPAAKSKKKVAAKEDNYTELVFPPRTVITATREIPQHDTAQARTNTSQTVARSNAQALQSNGQRNAGSARKSSVQGQRSAGKPRKRGRLAALFHAGNHHSRQQGKPKAKRQVVLSDARAQRRRRNLLAALGIVIAVVTGVALSLTVLFKIDTIVVEGETPYTAAEIILAFGRKEGENLLAFSAELAVETMQKKLPYLEHVKIHRVLPGKVRIEVAQAVEAYSVSSVSGWVVLSDTFRVLRIDPQVPEGLPQITGAEAIQPVLGELLALENPEKLAVLQALQTELNAQGLLPISEINLSDTLNLSFVYAGRIRIMIGTHNDLVNKIDWAKYLVASSNENSLPETESGTLDVSNRNEEGRMETIWRAGVL